MIEDKIKPYLANGAFFSAINEVLKSIDNVKGVNRGKLITLLTQLIYSDEVLASLDDGTISRISDVAGIKPKDFDPFYFIGKAYFPVYEPSGSRLVLLDVYNEVSNEILNFDLTDESIGDFLSVLSNLWQYLNNRITAPNKRRYRFKRENDTTVLNWGQKYRVHTNPFKDGKLSTEGLPKLSGRSLHFAMVVATASRIIGRPVDPNVILTGGLKSPLKSEQISHLKEKTEFILQERPRVKKIIIPPINSFSILDRTFIRENEGLFLQVDGFKELIEGVFNVEEEKLFEISDQMRHTLGASRIVTRYLGIMKLTLFDRIGGQDYNEQLSTFEVYYCKFTNDGIQSTSNVNLIQRINSFFPQTSGQCLLMILDVPNQLAHLANIVANDGDRRKIFAIGSGENASTFQIFASPENYFRKFMGKYLRLRPIWDRLEKINYRSLTPSEINEPENWIIDQ